MDRIEFLKYLGTGIVATAIAPRKVLATITNKSLEDKLFPLYKEVAENFELGNERVILVDGQNQRLYLADGYGGFRVHKGYDISTGKTGFGNKSGSGQTPTGIHRIKEKYGNGAPSGTIFRARQNTGKIAEIYTEEFDTPEDFVTSRIMWLDGCEAQNRNSHSRYIYIHGTPEEGLIGKPASHGCIRMKNRDVIELYNLVTSGTYVNIRERLG